MGKNKKKRNKIYTGAGSAQTRPIVTKVSATDRSKISQWYFEHKTIVKTIAIAIIIVTALTILIIEIFRALNS